MKIYKKVWRSAGGTPNVRVSAAVTIPTGKRKVVKVDCYSEGCVHRVWIKQRTGTNAAFTVRLLESSLPYGDETSNANYNAATAAEPEPFDVISGAGGVAQSVTSGNALDWKDSVGAPFIQMDSDTQSSRGRNLYLVIIPNNSADESTWEVAITVSQKH